ncbi:hypothetical protein OH807_39025 [Kitasatospora sp. NBC_01560]
MESRSDARTALPGHPGHPVRPLRPVRVVAPAAPAHRDATGTDPGRPA